MPNTLRIAEIFHSIQGESTFAGQTCTFIRLAGCNLRCRWCDTKYAQEGGESISLEDIHAAVESLNCNLVELTGGEPMCQADLACQLMQELLDRGKRVLLETNGSFPLDKVPQGVHRIIDLKAPGSGIRHLPQIWEGYASAWRPDDEIKCVVANREDFDWCLEKLEHYQAIGQTKIIFSPVWGELELEVLARWVCDSAHDIRLGLQIHKIIWDPNARGV